jgi:hypothetical protein
MKSKTKAILLGAVIVVPIATVIAGLIIIYTPIGMHTTPFYGASFNKDRWRTAYLGETPKEIDKKLAQCIRGPMFGDLRNRYLRPGTAKARVIELLGTPDFGSEGVKDGNKCQRWHLGYCSGFKIDLDSLNVCFDAADRVTHVFRLQH